jgi:biopolymer transport protein ExbB
MHYGLNNVWLQGDWVSRAILIALTLMSVLSWAVILHRGAQMMRLKAKSSRAERCFWQAATLDEAEASLGHPASNPWLALAETAREAQASHTESRLDGALGPDEWLRRCLLLQLDDTLADLQGGLALLASIGSTSPFVGLFGTVWGIYHALMSISAVGQSGLEQVAGPVGESLVMTAFGLFVAIPAVLGYNAIARGNRTVAHKLARFMHELQAYFVSGTRHRLTPAGGLAGGCNRVAAVQLAPDASIRAAGSAIQDGGR